MADLNGVPLVENLVPKEKWGIKCPFPMVAKKGTFHNTDNEVSAQNEIAYMIRNNAYTSFHYAADNKEIVQGVELDRNSWHAGDGRNGYGNRNTFSMEICYNYDRTRRTTYLLDPLRFMYAQAELNAIKASAEIYATLGIPATVNTVKKHQDWSGKNCPSKILNEKRWDAFQVAVIHEYNEYMNRGAVSGTVHDVKKGDTLSAIARAYEIQLGDLIKENGIKNPNVLAIGQKITIPLKSEKAEPIPVPKQSVNQVANEIVKGRGGWGNDPERTKRLLEKGYDPVLVQKRVDAIVLSALNAKKTWREVALDIFNGVGGWGNNPYRKARLIEKGYDPNQVQAEVDRLVEAAKPKPVKIREGDRVRASHLYMDAYAHHPVRRTALNTFVADIDQNGGWRNRYRLEGTKGRKNYVGYARLTDLKKI